MKNTELKENEAHWIVAWNLSMTFLRCSNCGESLAMGNCCRVRSALAGKYMTNMINRRINK